MENGFNEVAIDRWTEQTYKISDRYLTSMRACMLFCPSKKEWENFLYYYANMLDFSMHFPYIKKILTKVN